MTYKYTEVDGKRVEVNVAEAFKKLEAAFRRQFGVDLIVRSGTRTRAEQKRLYDLYLAGKGNQAAPPGLSNHEESGPRGPRALDVYDSGKDRGVMYAGSVRANWLRRHAKDYGFDPAGYRFRQVEPWHIEYTGVLSNQPADDVQAVNNPFGIADVRGLQKVAVRYEGDTKIDNIWGDGSAQGFSEYLRRVWDYPDDDNKLGPNMWKAIARMLRENYGYVGNDVPGPNMRAALDRANDSFMKAYDNSGQKVGSSKPAAPSNPFGISDVRGLQKIAQDNGGKTAIDNKWGPGSADGFANYLRRKWGYSGDDTLGPNMWKAIARWMRARYGYVGNDVPGPNMRAALSRANNANYKAS